MVTAIIQESLR